jgi:hypothetical protein
MTTVGRWTRVFIDSARCLVYGPSIGRLYLLDGAEALERPLQIVLGLRSFSLCETLADPAARVVHHRSNLRDVSVPCASHALRVAYRLLHWSRYIVPLGWAATIVRLAARLPRSTARATLSDIGRTLHAVESAAAFSDCYPRALLTAYLCLKSGRDCELVVGALAPTRKMHAWCCSDGAIPYEAGPEHYMYQPLIVFSLAH